MKKFDWKQPDATGKWLWSEYTKKVGDIDKYEFIDEMKNRHVRYEEPIRKRGTLKG